MSTSIVELKQNIGPRSKKEIEDYAAIQVQNENEEGFLKTLPELVMAHRLGIYFTARASALRPFAMSEIGSSKKVELDGAKLSISSTASRWTYDDAYLARLKEEVKVVEGKMQLADPRLRIHVTLEGEEVNLSRGVKSGGGETVKVEL